jgi:hypothetical protein
MRKQIAIYLLLLCLVPAAWAQLPDKNYDLALKALEKNQYADAVTAFGKVLEKQPEHLMALYYRSQALAKLTSYTEAINDLDKIIGIMPTNASFYEARAKVRLQSNNVNAAIDDYDAVTILDVENETALITRADLLVQQERYTEAYENYFMAALLNPQNVEAVQGRVKLSSLLKPEDKSVIISNNPMIAASGIGDMPVPGPVPDDQNTLLEKQYIREHKFLTIEEGRRYYNTINSRSDFAPGKKNVLLSMIREKILTDVYGEHPYMEDIEQMKKFVESESWINPEGRKRYFSLINDSRFWFTGGVQRGGTYFFYKVMKSKASTNKYRLQMFAVINNQSNLVFNSDVLINEDSAGVQREVLVYAAENKGYMWATSKTDFVKSSINLQNGQVEYQPQGGISRFRDANHGLSQDQYNRLTKPASVNELNDNIKATLNLLILEYPNLFSMAKR